MTMQNPFGMGLDVMRQLGQSQATITGTQGEQQRQQMLQAQEAQRQEEQARQQQMQQQQGLEQQQRQLYSLLGNVRQLPDAQSRMQAIQASPFAQVEGIQDLMSEQVMSDEGLDQILAASPFAQEQQTMGAGQREFESLIAGFTPEEQERARKIKAGLSPRAVGSAPSVVSYAGKQYMKIGEQLTPIQIGAGGTVEMGAPTTAEQIAITETVQPEQITPEQAVQEEIELEAQRKASTTKAVEGVKQDIQITAAEQAAYDSAQRTLPNINRMLASPALSSNIFTGALGVGSKTPPIPGTPEADFRAFFDTLKAQQFTNEISKMRGMGSLSDAEGKKVAAAAAALELDMSPEEFKRQLEDIKSGLETLAPPGTYSDEEEATINWEDL